MAKLREFLDKLFVNSCSDYTDKRSQLSFEEYLGHVATKPEIQLRNCAQYFYDLAEHFGQYQVKSPQQTQNRYGLFDQQFDNGRGKIFGQEEAQAAIFTHLKNFVKSGSVDKLILLHGPNGSSKTSIVQAISRAAEHYSFSPQGALYSFSWVFPSKHQGQKKGLGFSNTGNQDQASFAHLSNEELASQISSEQREHPLLLLSKEQRQSFFEKILPKGQTKKNLKLPQYLKNGELSHKNRQIFDALLASYNGDLKKLFRHIRVERFYLSRRYNSGISAVEPQMSVDASLRQITSDQSLMALPSALRHLSLFEVMGPLVEANRGLIEYNDLLKRPVDAWKYLLVACEQAQINVGSLSLFFDLIMLATSNELHLTSFKQYPDWQSFRARMELVRVPYLRNIKDEQAIYEHQMGQALKDTHVAPHAIHVAARWAVLTRLEPPKSANYPEHLRSKIEALSPDEKLNLYNFAEVPARYSQSEASEIKASIKQLYNEYQYDENYEGRFGASPREIRMIIFNAAQNKNYDHLAVGAIFEGIKNFIEQKSSYEFLRREPLRGYRDANFLLESSKHNYLEVVEDEIRLALGLFEKDSYLELFKRYILHVLAWTKKEKLIDPLHNKAISPDEQFMSQVERQINLSSELEHDFRNQLIGHIGAEKLNKPHQKIAYQELFSSHLKKLRKAIYQEQKTVVDGVVASLLQNFSGELDLNQQDKKLIMAQKLNQGLKKLGYNESSIKWMLAFVLSHGAQIKSDPVLCQENLNFAV